MKIHQSQSLTSLHLEILESSETVTRLLRSQLGIVKPKSKSQIQVPNLSPKFKVQSPEERDWDWGWHYNPTGHHPSTSMTF